MLGNKANKSESYREDPDTPLRSVSSDSEEEHCYRETSKSSSPEEEQKDNKESKKERRMSAEEKGKEEMGYKQFKLPKIGVFSAGSRESNLQSPFYNHEYRHYSRNKYECRNQFRRSVSPIKEIPATTNTIEGWNILRDIVEKLNISNLDDRNKDMYRNDDKNEKKHNDMIDIEKLSIRDPKGIKRRKGDDISLEELSRSLPKEKDFFVMNAINESLESISLFKKLKTTENHTQSETLSQAESNNVKPKLCLLYTSRCV